MNISTAQHRSCLFVPALNSRAMEKTLTLDVDAVIFDLEDSVSQTDKAQAHHNLKAFFTTHPHLPFYSAIRINRIFGNDIAELELAASLNANALVLPKVENTDELDFIYSISKSVAKQPIPLWAMIETPRGILAASAIASHPCVTCLVVGPNDIILASDIDVHHGIEKRQYLIPWLMQIILAAKAFNCRVLDGVYNDYQDDVGFTQECCQAKAMGFDGKTLIHPNQIAIANKNFLPTPDQKAWAQSIIDAFSLPENSSKGVITVDGKMVEELHLQQAKRIINSEKTIKNS